MLNQVINENKSLEELLNYEWLETNGLGGWSSSTIIGTNTRRYHALLMSARRSPVERYAMVSRFDEKIIIDGRTHNLSTNIYPNAINPKGFLNFYKFEKKLFPEIYYKIDDKIIKKTILCVHGENTVIVSYEIINNSDIIELHISPFLSSRNYHSLQKSISLKDYSIDYFDMILRLKRKDNNERVFIKAVSGEFIPNPDIYYNFEYPHEKERGLDYSENLFTPGYFNIKIGNKNKVCFIISTEDPHKKNPNEFIMFEVKRRNDLINKNKSISNVENILLLAADQFIVRRDKQLKTIIAGYHWFGDWGRDTMISLPGLVLTTQRYDEAKKILKAFTNYLDKGMLPNRFPDNNEEPEYNTVDATLWYFIAIYYFYLVTKDKNFVLDYLYPKLQNIIEWHEKGTRYNIHEDSDGLLWAGEEGVQLTWMDAKVDDWVVTHRIGKAVEINSLWFNAIKILEYLSKEHDKTDLANYYRKKSQQIKKSFNEKFWNTKGEYLFDVISNDYSDPSVRPNQLFALSLPFPLITKKRGEQILKIVKKELLTPFGLRSLSPHDPNYKGIYKGDQYNRDGAYHQGTVWSWLIGAYVDAIYFVYGSKAKSEIQKIISDMLPHISKVCIGSISEIFDGDEPHGAKGAVAQAWSVAEFLRIYKKYNN